MCGKKKLVIVGAGETAALAYEYFTYDSDFEVVAFAVDKEYLRDDTFCDLPLISIDDMPKDYPADGNYAFCALGSGELNRQRTRVFNRIKAAGYKCASYVSSKAFVWQNVSIGENCLILENNVLQPFTAVGDNVVMWSGNHVGHRSTIGNNAFVTSHVVISGFCSVGENSFLGVNSCLADNTSIGSDNFIAMGSCITRTTGNDEVYRGNPAMKMKLSAKVFCGVKD